jgi:hypothetical protein
VKIETINGRIRITADPGKRLTKGDGEYLLAIDCAFGAPADGYSEISEAEYEEIVREQEQEEANKII